MPVSSRALLHICCAPDATVPWAELAGEGVEAVGYFYGGNIHPRDEWERRRDAVLALARATGREVVIEPYDTTEWDEAVRGLESCPEGGERCAVCFGLQLAASARRAEAMGLDTLCTTLTISPHKDVARINGIGAELARMSSLRWIERVWRKRGGFARSVAMSREMGLYRQDYCGCRCSRRGAA